MEHKKFQKFLTNEYYVDDGWTDGDGELIIKERGNILSEMCDDHNDNDDKKHSNHLHIMKTNQPLGNTALRQGEE